MKKILRNKKGFTLIELMIVVAIIGILSAVAIPNFINFRYKAKTSEARANLGAIRTCEEAYMAELECYRACTASPAANTLAANDDVIKYDWADAGGFEAIGFRPTGQVYYQYTVTCVDVTSDFTGTAQGDLDDDGVASTFTITHLGAFSPEAGGLY